ncbi:MAG TPA: hypothetical protein VGK24_11920 [Candidatus Angelobacter sp.]|jgi:hypothetical protein
MTKKLCLFAIIMVLSFSVPRAKALQGGTPEDALEEMVTADNIEVLVKHMPVKVETFMQKLPPVQRAAAMEKLLVKQNVEREGGTLTGSSDGRSWEMVEKQGGEKTIFSWKKTFVSGTDALVQVELKDEKHTALIQVGMRYEEGEWRIIDIGEWRGTDLESELLPRAGATETNSRSAASILRTLNTSIVAYAATYLETGNPMNLQMLSGEENDSPTLDHAKLVDRAFAQKPAIEAGYEFNYVRTAQNHYQITATPVLSEEGSPSYFTDETAVIRFTTQNRPANANDPPLE